jgi:hypothetical protein
MPSTSVPELQQRISLATEDLAEAERAFWGALQLLRRGNRSDKVMVTVDIETAAKKISTAKNVLAALVAEQR